MTDAPQRLTPPVPLIMDPHDPAGADTLYLHRTDRPRSSYAARVDDPVIRDWILDAARMGTVVRDGLAARLAEILADIDEWRADFSYGTTICPLPQRLQDDLRDALAEYNQVVGEPLTDSSLPTPDDGKTR